MLGIYQIKNIESDKIYIGSSNNVERRFREHKKCLRGNRHRNTYLQNAWNKHGEDVFEFSVVYTVNAEEELYPHEQWCLDVLLPEYNIAKDVIAPARGVKFSEEHIAKLRKVNTGKHNPFYGKHHSKEAKAKIGKAHAGEKHWNYRKHHSQETCSKISQASIGENNSRSKLTAKQIRFAKFLRKAWGIKYETLGNFFGVSDITISRAVRGVSWTHLGDNL